MRKALSYWLVVSDVTNQTGKGMIRHDGLGMIFKLMNLKSRAKPANSGHFYALLLHDYKNLHNLQRSIKKTFATFAKK